MGHELRQILARYNFTKAELRDLVRELCPDEWAREQTVGDISASAPVEADAGPEDADYGELFVQISYDEENPAPDPERAPAQPWWIWALLVFSVVAVLAALVLVLVL